MRLLMFCAAVLIVGNGLATASVLLDQSHVLTRYMSGASVGGSIQQNVSQTVRVGISGQLTQLDFWSHRHWMDTGGGDLILDIRWTEDDGSPIEDDLSLLAQVVIPRSEIALSRQAFPPLIDPALISLDLTPFGLFFEAGDLFAFTFSNTWTGSTTSGIGVLGDYATGAGPYSPGQAFITSADYNGEFYLWAGTDIQVDLGFRTFVEPSSAVPEPSTIIVWSLLGGLGIVYGWHRKRNA